MYDVETRSGLKPVNSGNLPFEITTDQAEDFLQKKFNVAVNEMRSNGVDIDDVKVTLMSIPISRIFVPFMVVLPTSVIESKSKKKNKDDNEAAIFNPDNSSGNIRIHEEFYHLLGVCAYTIEDGQAFFSRDWRNLLGVKLESSGFLKYNRIPRVQKLNGGKDQFVTCLIDPLRTFGYMLEDPNSPSSFNIDIEKSVKIKDGTFKYYVTRVPISNKKNKKGHVSNKEYLARQLQNCLRG